ncbi:MAG: hypothetical protein MK207_13900 [Saprospiraceae bacterium]|nr:hypothetical protein [Saprospiraceae bacterium]
MKTKENNMYTLLLLIFSLVVNTAMLILIISLLLNSSLKAQDLTLTNDYFDSEDIGKTPLFAQPDQASFTEQENLTSKENNFDHKKQFNLVVVYESVATWAQVFNSGLYSQTGSETMNGIMASYDMTIIEQIEIDDINECIVLEINNLYEKPIDVARQLSMIEHVVMVYIKEIPQGEILGSDHKLSQY